MQLKPDELPDLVEGETRKVLLKLDGAVGINNIEEFTVTCDTLTITSPSSTGTSGTFFVTAGKVGTHHILASADLSSGETIKGYIRAKVVGEPCTSASDDYRD